MKKRLILFELILILGLTIAVSGTALAETSKNIVHDAEYYILEAQHGKKWKADDKNIDEKLAEFRNKNGGKSPNILYVLVDDLSFGEMGIPEFNYVRGSKTPRINKFADEAISFMRMYTEPSCTPSRVAMMTGRHPARNGLGEVKATVAGEALAASEKHWPPARLQSQKYCPMQAITPYISASGTWVISKKAILIIKGLTMHRFLFISRFCWDL
jgi:hypothetical protein